MAKLKLLLNIPKLKRKIQSKFLRSFLSPLIGITLKNFYEVSLGHSNTFVGWPIFKGNGKIVFNNRCILVSSRTGNPIGLFRPCIFEAINMNSKIEIGKNFSASGVCIVAESYIVIGDNVSIGANVTIIDTDFHTHLNADNQPSNKNKSKPIMIGDNVWVGMNAVILKGVKIHSNSVIGANAIITKDVPPDSYAVGNPARIINKK